MGQSMNYGMSRLSDEQLVNIQRGLALAAERMDEHQILEMADSLQGILCAGRRRYEHHRLDAQA